MADRKFVQDKVYLQGPKGQIYDYEPLLARQPGWKAVTPNSTKKATKDGADKPQEAQASRQSQQRHVGETSQAGGEGGTDTTNTDAAKDS